MGISETFANIHSSGGASRARLLRMGSVEAGLRLRHILPLGSIALIYEDGEKSYTSTYAGLQIWFPLLSHTGQYAHDDYLTADGAVAAWHFASERNLLVR